MGGSKISIRTSVLDDKANACNMLCCYADELQEAFFPWVERVRACLCSSSPHAAAALHWKCQRQAALSS